MEDVFLPETAEQHTPVGVKLIFGRWGLDDGEAFYKINPMYQSTHQLCAMERLTFEPPPAICPLRFEKMDADGRIAEEELFSLFNDVIDAYDALVEEYPEAEDEAA